MPSCRRFGALFTSSRSLIQAASEKKLAELSFKQTVSIDDAKLSEQRVVSSVSVCDVVSLFNRKSSSSSFSYLSNKVQNLSRFSFDCHKLSFLHMLSFVRDLISLCTRLSRSSRLLSLSTLLKNDSRLNSYSYPSPCLKTYAAN